MLQTEPNSPVVVSGEVCDGGVESERRPSQQRRTEPSTVATDWEGPSAKGCMTVELSEATGKHAGAEHCTQEQRHRRSAQHDDIEEII